MITFHVDGAEIEGKSDREIEEIMHKHAVDAVQSAQMCRLRLALRELDWHNPLDCEFHLYLHDLAMWGLGKLEKRPDAKADYGLDILIPDNVKGENP